MFRDRRPRNAVLATVALGYFIVFPDDLASVLAPLESVLGLTRAVAPQAYYVLAAGLIVWAMVRTRERKAADQTAGPRVA